MKNFARIMLVLMLTSMSCLLYAQTFGVKAGLNLSKMMMKDDDNNYSDEFKSNLGFHFGPTVSFPITEAFSFETGLIISSKGFRFDEEWTEEFEFKNGPLGDLNQGSVSYKMKMTMNPIYLEIPLTGRFTADLGGIQLYGLAGPYVAIGVGGKYKYEMELSIPGLSEKESGSEKINWGSDEDEDDLKRLDMGLNIGGGIQIGQISAGLQYGLGLANVSPGTDGGAKAKNRVFSITLGYRF